MPIETTAVMPHTHFEDFEVGQELEYGRATVTAEEIIRFGREFDPEPFHIGEEEAKNTMFGGLIASGIHMAAMLRRMQADGFANVPVPGLAGLGRTAFPGADPAGRRCCTSGPRCWKPGSRKAARPSASSGCATWSSTQRARSRPAS